MAMKTHGSALQLQGAGMQLTDGPSWCVLESSAPRPHCPGASTGQWLIMVGILRRRASQVGQGWKICLIQLSNWACTLRHGGYLVVDFCSRTLQRPWQSFLRPALQCKPFLLWLSPSLVTMTSQPDGPSSLLWLPPYFLSQAFPWINLNKPPVYLTLTGFASWRTQANRSGCVS